MPIMKEIKLVRDVMVIETAASAYVCPSRSGTVMLVGVRRQAANSTKASSMPTPAQIEKEEESLLNKLFLSFDQK